MRIIKISISIAEAVVAAICSAANPVVVTGNTK